MHRRMFLISFLLGPALIGSMPALSASPERLVYRVQHSRYGNIGTYSNAVEKAGNVTTVTLDISKDNVQFGVRAVDRDGNRSPVAFPQIAA